jgi:hypothetical protein
MSARARLIAGLCAAAALGGCGLGAGDGPGGGVQLTVTRDFGARALLTQENPETGGSDTVMRLLTRNAPDVRTRYGGGFVSGIGGVSGGRRAGRPVDWFFYVNGSEAEEGATSVDVHDGDRVWWDHHDWGVTPHIPAVVGSFPAPFVRGTEGKRLPVRVECALPGSAPCKAVADRLIGLGIPIGRSNISRSSADESLRVLVGPWARLRGRDAEADRIDDGPQASGVYARFDARGTRLTVLDPRGRPARTLGPGSGLIAATRLEQRQPVWFVTGTDAAGVASAARAFDESALGNRFALAVADDRAVGVPLVEGGGT